MSQVTPNKNQRINKSSSFKEDLATSEVSSISKSPNRKSVIQNSRLLDAYNYTPKVGGPVTPSMWPNLSHDKGFGATLDIISETNEEKGRKRPSKGRKTDKDFLLPSEKEEGLEETQVVSVQPKPRCDYTSLIVCFPENILSVSTKNNDRYFNPFSELVKSTTNKHDGRRLESLLKESQLAKSVSPEVERSVDKKDLVKKVLEFNKIQKRHYIRQASVEKRNALLPLIKQVQDKAKHHVKVLPSRKLYEDVNTTDLPIDEKKPVNQTQTAVAVLQRKMTNSASTSALIGRKSNDQKGPATLKAYEDKFFELPIPMKNYKVYWVFSLANESTWKPDVREGHTFTTVGRQIYLYGGLGSSLLEEIAVFDPVTNLWEKPQVTGDIPLSGRHGHTACEYKKTLIIFGGEHQFNPTLNIRECLNDLRMFMPEKNEWKLLKTNSQITPRRHHASALHYHSMLVYGGINSEGNYIRDVWNLNLRSWSWDKVDITGDKEHGIAFHTMCACYVDKSVGLNKDNKARVSEEGIYVFGGKNTEGKILNTLKIFTLDTKTPQWIYPATKGNPPTARYNHTMLFYEPLGLLIIYGGRNDSLYESLNDVCLNDIRILNLGQMSWSQVSSYGDIPKVGRYRHAVAGYGSKMIIFGGVEFHKYADDQVKSVELNQAKVKKVISEAEAEGTNDKTKSLSESLPPLGKEKRKKYNEDSNVSPEAKTIKRIVSFLPIPTLKQMGTSEGDHLKLSENFSVDERPIHIVSRFES